MDLNRAFLFIKIVEAGNISNAARILNEPKAKLSRNLALLEEELGVQLVYRTTRQFRLTDAGVEFYQNSKDHIAGLMEAAAHLKTEEQISGPLRITAPDDIGIHVISKIVHEFSALHPAVNFELIYSNEMIDLVKQGVDVAFRVGQLKDSSMIQKKIGDVEFIIAASPKYLNKVNPLVSVDDLPSYQTIGFNSGERTTWKLTHRNKKKSIRLKHKFLINNFVGLRDLVIDGHGIGYLPKFLCHAHLASGELIQILKQWGDEGAPLHIIVPQQKKISPKVRQFMDFAAKRIGYYF